MNICYLAGLNIIPSRNANGVHVMKMCQAYAGLGHRVTLILPELQGCEPGVKDVYSFYDVLPNFAIRKIPIPYKCPNLIYHGIVRPLAAIRTKPDLVHARSLMPAWGSTNLFRVPTIYEMHHPYDKPFPQLVFKRIISSGHLRTFAVITQALADYMKTSLPKNVSPFVAPDGVDATWLRQQISQSDARIKLNLLHEKRRIVVYVGGLYQGRGIELIIELARYLADHLFLIVGGRENDVTHYREKAQHLTNLQFVGFKPPAEVYTHLCAADVLLMPYSNQVKTSSGKDTSAFASPIKMFEYMAAGRPILATTLPVLQEILQDGKNAMLLPYDQPQRWCEGLRQLQQNSQLAEALGRQARLDVEQYTWENRALRLLAHNGISS